MPPFVFLFLELYRRSLGSGFESDLLCRVACIAVERAVERRDRKAVYGFVKPLRGSSVLVGCMDTWTPTKNHRALRLGSWVCPVSGAGDPEPRAAAGVRSVRGGRCSCGVRRRRPRGPRARRTIPN